MKQLILFDTEYASWDGFLTDCAENKKKAEIVQIAALKVNAADLTVAEEFNLYIKPFFRPKLTQYFINLTGITDELLAEKGVGFPQAYEEFKKFVGDCPCFSHGWSLAAGVWADGEVIVDNLKLWDMRDDKLPDFRNIATWFRQEYQKCGINIEKQCSGEIARLLGCESELCKLGLEMHNALYDVYSILAGLRKLGFALNDEAGELF